MGNAMFIVWRESVEAILVVGILYAWLQNNDYRAGLRWLWAGVAGGAGLAASLGAAMLAVQSQLAGDALEGFQAIVVFAAAGLITHMVLWMRSHGKSLKSELEVGLSRAAQRASLWGVAALAALAVGREGAETVIFLYGLGLERHGAELGQFIAAAAAGFVLALATGWLLSAGRRFISWRTFFRVTEAVLLLLAGALVVAGVEKLNGLGWLPTGIDPLWDAAAVLDDGHGVGGFLAAFAGWRARPSLSPMLALAAYWLAVAAAFHAPRRLPNRTGAAA